MKFYALKPFQTAHCKEGNYSSNAVAFEIISREAIQSGGADCFLVNEKVLDLLTDYDVRNISFTEIDVKFSVNHDMEFGEKKSVYNKYRIIRTPTKSIIDNEGNEYEVEYEDDYTQPLLITKTGWLCIREDFLKIIHNDMRLKKCEVFEIDNTTTNNDEIEPDSSLEIKDKSKSELRSGLIALALAAGIFLFFFH